ncbi:NADH dehydrogenase [ubiquinone] 1 beta subcomplex subunit 5 mitochondrial [Fasciola gigantica]|uniref:NADH dehydrogenase [ubiquinone] 1 beta subcomplex subunit 5, mitochondrial n=1 Tax=Fasciola gigantica TaxID=46835 RepID=A0A504Z469_FASGI|nr:NADH dehydrogenase [ubiquinone] 1 beta subcomplex subunit 5 mitochondrial [Fasciola gigantica]
MFTYFRDLSCVLRIPSMMLMRNLCTLQPKVKSIESINLVTGSCVRAPNPYMSSVLRHSSSKSNMVVKSSEFMNKKIFDSLHFFVMLGAVPCLMLVFFVNVFVGPAELADIPEGHEPRYWEYHRHPITRFIAKHILQHPQKVYEVALGQIADKQEQLELVEEERWFRRSQRIHGDYRGWYFIPSSPVGVVRGRKEQELDQEIGEFVSR